MIQNTKMHEGVGVICEPFGDTGAVRLVPVKGESLGAPFILDVDATDQLARELRLIVDQARGLAGIKETT